VSGEALEGRQEVYVGHRVLASDGRPPFIGEIIRFRGKLLGGYTATPPPMTAVSSARTYNWPFISAPAATGFNEARRIISGAGSVVAGPQ